MRCFVIHLTIIISIILSGCQTISRLEPDRAWQYLDLRAMDAADSSLAAADILAVYLRMSGSNSILQDWQIRLDFLDLSYLPECDIYIAFDIEQGESNHIKQPFPTSIDWDTLLVISATMQISLYDSTLASLPANGIRVYRDAIQDTITIDLSGKLFQHPISKINFQVITTSPGYKAALDSTNIISSTDNPPPPAEILLAFWNAFPAFTPAQALRRWDGAHTGPKGGRHGLYHLLTSAQNHSAPLVLLDLKYPSSLSALDYVGGLDLIRDMLDEKLLILPDPLPVLSYSSPVMLPDEILKMELLFTQTTGLEYHLPRSKSVFSLFSPINIDNSNLSYSTVFNLQPLLSSPSSIFPEIHLSNCAGQMVVPIPFFSSANPYYDQTTPDGPSLNLRRALIANAILNTQFSTSDPAILILGGELPTSSWGIADETEATLDYFDNHPWIHLIDQNDLFLSSNLNSNGCLKSKKLTELTLDPQTIQALISSPDNIALSQAIHMISSLTTPIFPDSPGLLDLRKNYIHHIDELLEIANWVENPFARCDCNLDPNPNGQKKCVLSSEQYILIIDPNNGNLRYAYFINNKNLHQIIGPSSLLVTGLSNPGIWDISAGELSDPSVIPGAFWAENHNIQIDLSPDYTIHFSSPEGIKSYALSSEGISIQITEPPQTEYQIPFLLDPWLRFTNNWIKSVSTSIENMGDNSYSWEYMDGSTVILTANQPLTLASFADSLDFMDETENPDMDYPKGHFLPIPLILAEISHFSPPLIINISFH